MQQDLVTLHKQFVGEQRYATRLSEATLHGYEQTFDLLMQVMPGIAVDQLTTGTMTEFFQRLETRTRIVGHGIEKRGVKKSTIATYRSKLNRFFQWLAARNYIEGNPFATMEYPYVEYADRKYLNKGQIEKILAAIVTGVRWACDFDRKRNLAMIETMLFCGLRRGEMLKLTVMDLDLERRQLTVRAETSKSKLTRTVPVNTSLMPALTDYLAVRRERHLTTPYLFASSVRDAGCTMEGLKNAVEQIVKTSGVKFHPHLLRHTYAVNLAYKGCDIAKLKQLMGHRDIRMTAVYLRCLPNHMMRADAERLSLDSLV